MHQEIYVNAARICPKQEPMQKGGENHAMP